MVSSSPVKKGKTESTQNINKSLGVNKKPLQKFKFYLDIKNNNTSKKLEGIIKNLGGVLELFLIKEVTHVITDREEWYKSKGGGSNPRTPQGTSHELQYNAPDESPKVKSGRIRPKTRADAMLENAQKSSTNNFNAKNPFDNAKLWGVAIWTVEKAFSWLEKVTASITIKRKEVKVFQLKTPYIKFEAFDRQTRPIFKEIHNWPIINLDGPVGDPGLICRSRAERNMTRKTRSHQPRLDTALQPGYCEVCRADYPRLDKHLESDKHQSFISDSANFLELDTLINDGTNIETFLNLNNISIDPKDIKVEEIYTPPVTRNKMPKTRTTPLCEKMKNSLLTPTDNDIGHRLRPRVNLSSSYLGSTALDYNQPLKPEGAKECRELRSSARQMALKQAESTENDTHFESGRPKRAINKKRISADERLVVDNKTYYKVEVMSSKLRSSGQHREYETLKRVQIPIQEEEEEEVEKDDKGLIVKFKRMRTSELEQLNNEAENFLFPRRDESSSEEDIDANNPNTTVSSTVDDSTVLLSSEDEKPLSELRNVIEEDLSMDSACSDNSKKKKRRTHAEAFILDNQKYYKFETPGSRLRYHGSFMPQIPVIKSPKTNGECLLKINTEVQEQIHDTENNEQNSKFTLEDFSFSFETIPKSEPWYQTFQRQDQGREYYTCFSDSGYWKPFLLPYELPPIPPLDPKVCIQAYEEVKKQIAEAKSTTTSSTSCSTPEPSTASGSDFNTAELHEDNSKTSEDSVLIKLNENVTDKKSLPPKKRGRKKGKRIIIPSKNPRKSPRQHASTLAILSSLIHQRKRRELNKSKCSDNESSKPSLSAIPEENSLLNVNYELVSKTLDEMFDDNVSLNEVEIAIPMDDTRVINVSYNADAIQALEDFESQKNLHDSSTLSPKLGKNFMPKRRPGRKKKKNRTGWPKTRRLILKKDVKEEVEENTVDSTSVTEENECDEKLIKTDPNSINNENIELSRSSSSRDELVLNPDQNSLESNVNNSDSNCVQNDTEHNNHSDNEDRVNRKDHPPIEELADNCNTKSGSLDKCVDLEKWEKADKVLSAKLTNTDALNSDFQPYVRIQKISDVNLKQGNRRLRSSSSPLRTNIKRPRRMPASPKSPRSLRKPRGRWYRER